MNIWCYALVLLFLFHSAFSQTFTITNNTGETIVQVISTDPVNSNFLTTTIRTFASPTTSSHGTASVPNDPHQGPVGQPAPTQNPDLLTPYTYTTVINGITTRIADIFTPTFPATTRLPDISDLGTIMEYSSWLEIYGNPAQPANAGLSNRGAIAWLSTAFLGGLLGGGILFW